MNFIIWYSLLFFKLFTLPVFVVTNAFNLIYILMFNSMNKFKTIKRAFDYNKNKVHFRTCLGKKKNKKIFYPKSFKLIRI